MEIITKPKSRLTKEVFCKIPESMLILPYFGNALEWANMLKELRRGSRKMLKNNFGKWKAVLKLVMKAEEHKANQAVEDWSSKWKYHFTTHSLKLDLRQLSETWTKFIKLFEELDQNREKYEVNILQPNAEGLQKYYFLDMIWILTKPWDIW